MLACGQHTCMYGHIVKVIGYGLQKCTAEEVDFSKVEDPEGLRPSDSAHS